MQTRVAPASLSAVFRELMLDAETRARLESTLAHYRDARDPLLVRLQAVIANAEQFSAQYASLAATKPEVVAEEKVWLVALIRAAFAGERGQWAGLYFSMNYQELLCRRIDHRLNPRSLIRMPSAFVYAMQ